MLTLRKVKALKLILCAALPVLIGIVQVTPASAAIADPYIGVFVNYTGAVNNIGPVKPLGIGFGAQMEAGPIGFAGTFDAALGWTSDQITTRQIMENAILYLPANKRYRLFVGYSDFTVTDLPSEKWWQEYAEKFSWTRPLDIQGTSLLVTPFRGFEFGISLPVNIERFNWRFDLAYLPNLDGLLSQAQASNGAPMNQANYLSRGIRGTLTAFRRPFPSS